jgi:hypothetical protein
VTAEPPVIEVAMIEREIAERIKAAKLRLRFDKAVLRLVDSLKASLAGVVPEGQTVIFTVTAPIKLRAKTAAALEDLVRGDLLGAEVHRIIHGNRVRVRRVTNVPTYMPRVVGFVHNPESDAGLIMAQAESRLLGRD